MHDQNLRLTRNVVYLETDTVEGSGVVQNKALGKGDLDFYLNFSGPLLLEIDRGLGITVLAGIHVGCFELFAKEGIRSVADLRGRTVGVQALESPPHVFFSAIASLVGLDPAKDIEWVTTARAKPIELFTEKKIDSFLEISCRPRRNLPFPHGVRMFEVQADAASAASDDSRLSRAVAVPSGT